MCFNYLHGCRLSTCFTQRLPFTVVLQKLSISSSGVRGIWGHFAPLIFQVCSTGQPTSCAPRRVETPSPDDPADLETFRTCTDRPVCIPRDFSLPVVLLPDRGNTRHGCADTQLAAGSSHVCFNPSETLCKIREDEEQVLLMAPYWPTRTWFPELMLLVTAPPWRIPLRKDLLTQRRDTLWHPRPDLWKLHVWVGPWTGRGSSRWPTPRGSQHHHFGESTVYETVEFVEWCSSHREDPRKCTIRVVLSYLQQGLERRLSPSTLKVYVAVIAANNDLVNGKSVGKHDWVIRFLRGGEKVESSTALLYTLLGPVSSAQSTTAGPIWALANSRAEVSLNENSTPGCNHLQSSICTWILSICVSASEPPSGRSELIWIWVWICDAPAAYLYSRYDQRQLDAIIACQCALARLVYTRSGFASLSGIPIRRLSDVTSPFPRLGNEGYIRNQDVFLSFCFMLKAREALLWNHSILVYVCGHPKQAHYTRKKTKDTVREACMCMRDTEKATANAREQKQAVLQCNWIINNHATKQRRCLMSIRVSYYQSTQYWFCRALIGENEKGKHQEFSTHYHGDIRVYVCVCEA